MGFPHEASQSPAGKATAEDPAGTRRLKRCPRKASSCSKNQQQGLTELFLATPASILTLENEIRRCFEQFRGLIYDYFLR
ncbi:MAG: hypothetical protein LRY73_19190 [Bacillus sp. (in: Bacteria)]|nr:hypothetical protein [Bacillus sp. (in: firmicutes)]